METDYFTPGPLSEGGAYARQRGAFDGLLGFFDGLSSATNSVGNTVDAFADIREDVARGRAAIANQRLDVDEREQAMLLDRLKTERGDNVQLYWVAGAVGLGLILLWR